MSKSVKEIIECWDGGESPSDYSVETLITALKKTIEALQSIYRHQELLWTDSETANMVKDALKQIGVES
jgi:metal-dependent amidase/aminoacylase/carboxypeptidase family protein